MRYLIFGAGGRVGSFLARRLTEWGCEAAVCGRGEVDLVDSFAIEPFIEKLCPECVVNCAAVSGVDEAFKDPLTAHLVNALAPAMMARCCQRLGIRFIHLSTDYVLDGSRPGLKDEASRCRPCCVYGESKLEGELQVVREMPGALVLRVSWVCGNPMRPSFAEVFAERVLRGEALSAIADKTSLPTHVESIARTVAGLASRGDVSGVFHLCSIGEPMSWHGYATQIARELMLRGRLVQMPEIIPIRLEDMNSFLDSRPMHTAMNAGRLSNLLDQPLPSSVESVACAVELFLEKRSSRRG
ncbi:MAG: NAD(P)-dependent oxidoreductase [Akkermansia sp.]|nr:NAD(P)-dependent oxidoreductase [Akkermansia sp.]MCD8070383.1 NAD(P)-dependent oxidoreductase [Akkermansiaceae bacterium]